MKSCVNKRAWQRPILLIVMALVLAWMVACSPYASLSIGAPFKVGPVYVNPSIGVGSFL